MYYPATPQARHQLLADMEMGLRNGNPTIIPIGNQTHAVVFVGTSWSRLADAVARPSLETVTVHDPGVGYDVYTQKQGGASVVLSFGFFLNNVLSNEICGGCARVIAYSGQQGSGNAALNDFNAQGGRYVGPTPVNPTGRYMIDGNGVTCLAIFGPAEA